MTNVRIEAKDRENTATIWNDDKHYTLYSVHRYTDCAERECVIHTPSDHHMRSWPLHWRDDRAIFERICEHGVGHPDPDQFAYWRETRQEWQGVHGCDGCCHD